MVKTMNREHVGVIVLEAAAQATLEAFILAQLGSETETELEISPATEDHIKAASLIWEDDGEGGMQVRLNVRFEAAGSWTAD